jgi:hypothetical protein
MKSNSQIRSLVRALACVALALATPFSFGAAAERKQAQAQVLDHAEVLCDNCLFGPSYYYYCFAVDDKVLIAYQRVPVINWDDKSKNYLTRARRKWTVWSPPGETMPVSYDDQHLWVTREDGKEVKMIQRYSLDIFIHNPRCREAVKAKAN